MTGKTIGAVANPIMNGGKVENQGDVITNAVVMVTGVLGRIGGWLATGGPVADFGSAGPLEFLFGGDTGGISGKHGFIGDIEGGLTGGKTLQGAIGLGGQPQHPKGPAKRAAAHQYVLPDL